MGADATLCVYRRAVGSGARNCVRWAEVEVLRSTLRLYVTVQACRGESTS